MMNTNKQLDRLGELEAKLQARIARYQYSKGEMLSTIKEIEQLLQGSVVCDLAGTGFILTDEPDPASDRRRYTDIESPSYLRRGHPPISLKTFAK